MLNRPEVLLRIPGGRILDFNHFIRNLGRS
jgi:hypothetical protein